MGKEEIRQLEVTLRPVALSEAENRARIRRLCRLIFPRLKKK